MSDKCFAVSIVLHIGMFVFNKFLFFYMSFKIVKLLNNPVVRIIFVFNFIVDIYIFFIHISVT